MRMLYLSCHGILEFDEIRMFSDIGYDVFSNGEYHRNEPVSRPKIKSLKVNDELIQKWNSMPIKNHNIGRDLQLTKEFVDNFDVVYIMHVPDFLEKNWEVIKHKTVVWRSIGQSSENIENILKPYRDNIKIIRYSSRELLLPNTTGADVIINFSKRPHEHGPWIGNIKRVATVGQTIAERGEHCGWNVFRKLSDLVPCSLFGHNNQKAGSLWNGYNLNYNELLDVYRNHRVYFYNGTRPACYTLSFMEAMLTGIPIVSVGKKLGNWPKWPAEMFEIPYIIENGVDGFVSDDINEMKDYINLLFLDDNLTKTISDNSIKKAIKLFDEDIIKKQWIEFFGGI